MGHFSNALTGAELRDLGIDKINSKTPEAWKTACDLAIARLALTGQEFTAEDVRRAVGDPHHPNAMGARFNVAAKQGVIEHVGYRKPARASRHAAPIGVWRGRR